MSDKLINDIKNLSATRWQDECRLTLELYEKLQPISLSSLGDIINRSKGHVHKSLDIARAMMRRPEIAELESRKQAYEQRKKR